ncbi:MAG: hypothetical protein ACRYG8_34615, partial [Janthinobacterium lividum]
MPVSTPATIVVYTEAQLNAAIAAVATGSSGAYTISLASPIAVTTPLATISVPSGSSLVIQGNGYAVDGGGTQHGFVVSGG